MTLWVTADLPLPPASLRVILRNLLRNAVAAGAHRVHVVAVQSAGSSRLLVIDDGAGLAAVGGYTAGSGLGLTLCRRIDFNREPSSGESSRTNTSGGRIATSTVVMSPKFAAHGEFPVKRSWPTH